MRRIQDTIYDVLDQYTGEYSTYNKVTLYYDGTSMSDAKCDGVIYRKLGIEYFRRVFVGDLNAKWFGVTGDGVTDDTNNMDRAFLACVALKKMLYVPEGTYILNKQWNVRLGIRGAGKDKTIFKIKDSSAIALGGHLFYAFTDNVTLRDFSIDGNRVNNLGTSTNGIGGIGCNNAKYLKIIDVIVRNCRAKGLFLSGFARGQLSRVDVDSCGRYGTEAPAAQADRIGVLLDNNVLQGDANFTDTDTIIEYLNVTNCGGDGVVTGVGTTFYKCKSNNNGVELASHDPGCAGFYSRPPMISNGVIQNLTFLECEANNNTGLGIDVGNNAGSALSPISRNVKVIGCTTVGNRLLGIGMAGTRNGLIALNISYNNGTQVTLASSEPNYRRAGIGLDGVAGLVSSDILVTNNICYDNQSTKTQIYPIYFGFGDLVSAGSSNIKVWDNKFDGNSTASPYVQNKNNTVTSGYLSVQNNIGLTSHDFLVVESDTIAVNSPLIKLSAASNVNVLGIKSGLSRDEVVLENISAFNITLVNSVNFILGNENLVLPPSAKATFKCIEGAKWERLLSKTEQDTIYALKVSTPVTITTTTQQAIVNTKYIANNAGLVTITLPLEVNAAIGDQVLIRGKGAGLWRLAQNALQLVHLGATDTTAGTGGSLTATNRYDAVVVEKIAANEWLVVSVIGTLTVV